MIAHSDITTDNASLADLIEAYQDTFVRWQSAPVGEGKEQHRKELRAVVEMLWPRLQVIVQPLAQRWARWYLVDLGGSRGWSDAVDSVNANMCLDLIDELPGLSIQRDKRIDALLRTIAQRRIIDEYRSTLRRKGYQRSSDDSAAQARDHPQTTYLDDELINAIPDELSSTITTQVHESMHLQQCWEAVSAFLDARLSPKERVIFRERLRDPPTSHRDIAVILGEPWTESSTRKRFSRLIEEAREHLRSLGLLPGDIL